ncbi:MAG: hypothetical protein V4503_01610 [Gemmatimonadota bacterium]
MNIPNTRRPVLLGGITLLTILAVAWFEQRTSPSAALLISAVIVAFATSFATHAPATHATTTIARVLAFVLGITGGIEVLRVAPTLPEMRSLLDVSGVAALAFAVMMQRSLVNPGGDVAGPAAGTGLS